MLNLKTLCEVLKANDRNSDIMDVYTEYLNGQLDESVITEIIERELSQDAIQVLSDVNIMELQTELDQVFPNLFSVVDSFDGKLYIEER